MESVSVLYSWPLLEGFHGALLVWPFIAAGSLGVVRVSEHQVHAHATGSIHSLGWLCNVEYKQIMDRLRQLCRTCSLTIDSGETYASSRRLGVPK